MKLRNVLKGHKTDRSVKVTNGVRACDWSGEGIEHIVKRYCPDFLEKKVVNVTKTYYGTTIIEVEL